MGPVPFRVFHSGHARELFTAVLQQATAAGRRSEAIAAARVIERGLVWFADGFGESRLPLKLMGELRCATILPITVFFAVDTGRRTVQVSRYQYVRRRPRP